MSDAVVGACCVINLYAAGDLLALLPPLGLQLHVPEAVLGESLYVRQLDPADAAKLVQREVDLGAAIGTGLLHRCDLEGDEEFALFVQLALTLDDGEATCLAIAKVRDWALATDDRKARQEASEIGVGVFTTPELVKAWADTTKASRAAVAKLLRNIQDFARFTPHKTMPLHSWWQGMVEE